MPRSGYCDRNYEISPGFREKLECLYQGRAKVRVYRFAGFKLKQQKQF